MDYEKLTPPENIISQETEVSLPQFALEQATKDTPVSPNELPSVDLERFTEMPNRRQSLRAKDENRLTVFLSHAIAKKLYRCPCCHTDINIGSDHVIMSRVQMSKSYNHHHIDFDCTQKVVLPSLSAVEIIAPHQASATAVNKRARRYRNKNRK